MNIKKKILGITIAPVIILGLISMFFDNHNGTERHAGGD